MKLNLNMIDVIYVTTNNNDIININKKNNKNNVKIFL